MAPPEGRPPIVVGVDPGRGESVAVAWAADEAERRHLPLLLVLAEDLPASGHRVPGRRRSWERWKDGLRAAGDHTLKDAVAFVESRRPQVQVDALLTEGRPARVLHEQAQNAAQVVLGSWHLSSVQERFTSAAVALPLVARAPCPVVVVPEPEHTTTQDPYFVVGVDGSRHSAAAVDYAFEESARRGTMLRALHVWLPPRPGSVDEATGLQECRRLLSETVAGRTARYPEVDLRHEVVAGHPVQVLTKASEHALGLVVGTRGRGGFPGMLLGSVSQGVVLHGRCPVITVPYPPNE